MPPKFEQVTSFVDVPITDDGVDTPAFLDAADGLMDLFDLFGSVVFGFVQTDLRTNITGVRARYASHTAASTTLERLVEAEHADRARNATACLVRLVRGLAFTCRALQELQADDKAELHVCFRRAYDVVLKHHHSFVIRSVVTIAIRAVPRRADFFMSLAEGGDQEKLRAEMSKWLAALDAIAVRVSAFLANGGYGRV
ncbi:glycolipid transfer protein [Vararia minispora EC-137]|uniref:Glycolipid transfer protein n=1 Tax=Vararia minispora EC-137 TaxID=1314806 RepID=A0ACB8Q7T5_9AGAM|nr:glycolipid transfer protein [Vararia minispora EC-137]